MQKSLIAILAIISLGLGGVIFVQARTVAKLNEMVNALRLSEAELKANVERDRAELENVRVQIATYRDESEALRKKLAAGVGQPSNIASALQPNTPADNTSGGAKWMQGLAKMFTDPEMKKTMKAQQSMGISMIYGDFFKKLGLSPQDTAQLADILAERQLDLSAAAMSAMGADGKPADDQGKKVIEATQRYDEQLKATLGEANYKKLQDYEKTMGDRFMLQQYDGQFAAAGAPLESSQREALLNIMQEERLRMPDTPFGADQRNPQAQIAALQDDKAMEQYFAQQAQMNQRVLERARQTLSADQVAALEKAQQQMTEMMQGQMKMGRAMFGK